jgi:hypothetical protein
LSPYYYDPYYFDDPYYYGYSRPHKLSCNAVQRSLRRQGYRNVRAYDCRGSQYGFYATRNHKRYKVIVNSRSGQIVRRVRQ